MLIVGDLDTMRLILGIVLVLCIYWVAKAIISLWTGA